MASKAGKRKESITLILNVQNHQARETGIGGMKQQKEAEASEELAKKGEKLF